MLPELPGKKLLGVWRRGPPMGVADGSPMFPRPLFVAPGPIGILDPGIICPCCCCCCCCCWDVGGGLGLLRSAVLFWHMLTMCSFKSLWIGALLAMVCRQSCNEKQKSENKHLHEKKFRPSKIEMTQKVVSSNWVLGSSNKVKKRRKMKMTEKFSSPES